MDQSNYRTLQHLTVLNWNADGLKHKKNMFASFLVRHNIDIACITETHFIRNENFKTPGYSIYREDRNGNVPQASGGVAIVVKRNINHHSIFLPQLISIEAVGIKLNLQNDQHVNLISGYKSPNRRLNQQDLLHLFHDDTATLMLGDINCKHQFWGCRINNPNGVRLLRFINNNNVDISAPTEPTHHPWQNNFHPDILDIALHKNFTAPIHQQVLSELDSDHLPVILYFFVQPAFSPQLPRLISGKVDWTVFCTELDNRLKAPTELYSVDGIDCAVNDFTEC